MKIYLDYLLVINFLFDLILLLGISSVLKRNTSKKRIILGSIFGSISFFIIMIPSSSTLYFILKLLTGLLMVIITFSYKNIKYTANNFIYLIILSILLGGSLYLTEIQIKLTKIGMLYKENDKSLNIIVLIIISAIMMIIYNKITKAKQKEEKLKYNITLNLNNKKTNLTGFLDTGNTLTYQKSPVLILNKNINLSFENKKIYYIPFTTINSTGVMKAIKINKIKIDEKEIKKNIFIASSNDKFHLGEADIILNSKLWEEKNETENKKTN